jgi:hypothetical protein
MKTKFYFLITFVFFALAVSAQKYNVMLVEDWLDNSWTNSLRTTNTYDSNGKLLKMTSQVWNSETGVWDNSIIISHTLNSDGTIKETLTQAWSKDDGTWSELLAIFTYSDSKKILTETTQISMGDLKVDYMKMIYTYNDKDSLATLITQNMDFQTLQLVNSSQVTYSYNPDGTEHQNVVQTWNVAQWANLSRSTNTYNDSKQVTSSLDEKWENEAWVNVSRNTITYLTNGTVQGELEETWVDNAWVNSSRFSYTFNANLKIIKTLDELWGDNAWVNDSQSMWSYTTNGEIEQIVSQDWKTDLAQWENTSRITYDYNSTGIDPEKLARKGSVVYPNPFKDQITIQSSTLDDHAIQVFNAAGQLIQSIKTNKSVTHLNLGALEKGVYFMKIKTAKNEQTVKLLKAR